MPKSSHLTYHQVIISNHFKSSLSCQIQSIILKSYCSHNLVTFKSFSSCIIICYLFHYCAHICEMCHQKFNDNNLYQMSVYAIVILLLFIVFFSLFISMMYSSHDISLFQSCSKVFIQFPLYSSVLQVTFKLQKVKVT